MAPISNEEARAADLARVGDDAVERRAVGIPSGPTQPAADAPRASTRGIYRDLEGRRRVVAAGDVVPDGWSRVETAVVADRIGEVPTNLEDGVVDGGAPAGEAPTSTSRSRSSSSSSSSSSNDGDDVSKLTGEDLDKAVADAGIDASTGGSRADGGMTAEEKRDALRKARS